MLDFYRAQTKYTSDNPDAPDTEPMAFVFDGEREQVVNLARDSFSVWGIKVCTSESQQAVFLLVSYGD